MELMFPVALGIGLAVVLVLIFLKVKKTNEYKSGVRVANVGNVEKNPYFKSLAKKYLIFKTISMISLLLAVASCFLLMSRIVEISTINPEVKNKDVFICLDISDSVDEINYEVCDQLKEVVEGLKGERFGISIFNARSVLLVPLTTDYEYVIQTLDQLKECFKQSMDMNSPFYSFNEDFSLYAYNYKYEGTLCDYGSSFIGDGLAACLFDFTDIEEDPERSRVIIFATDNELNGEPFVSVTEATDLCKEKKVKVYAIAPDNIIDEENFKKDIEKTGGQYFRAKTPKVVKNIINEIKKQEGTKFQERKTVVTDYPCVPFVLILIFVGIHLWTSRQIKE